jgi:tRNA A37 threonylcarbamoyladenosine dehydratase
MDNYKARFGGIRRLLSEEGLERLRRGSLCVVGIGGVGSWAVEALARSGIGRITLIDLDDVCISNVNRQLHAVEGEFGRPKVEVMARRVRAINPECHVNAVLSLLTRANAAELLSEPYDYVLDAIDSPSKKCLLIAICRARGIRVLTTGAAAGRTDPTQVRVTDLAFTSHDRLLQEVRKKLRARDGFPRGDEPFNVPCVYSPEPPVFARKDGTVCSNPEPAMDLRIDCQTGFGTASFVTGAFGFAAAGYIVRSLAGEIGPNSR